MSLTLIGCLAEIRRLIRHGADVNAKDDDGNTSLMWAESPEVVTLLIEAGADVNAKTKDGWRVLIFAQDYSTPEIFTLLIEAGAV